MLALERAFLSRFTHKKKARNFRLKWQKEEQDDDSDDSLEMMKKKKNYSRATFNKIIRLFFGDLLARY